MIQHIDQTPGGLFVVTTDDPLPPPPPEPTGLKCANCDRRTTAKEILLFTYKTKDGFRVHKPTCKCGEYLLCPDCEGKQFFGCPACGERCEYT